MLKYNDKPTHNADSHVRELFEDSKDWFTSYIIIESGSPYSLLRINNTLRELFEEGYLIRKRVGKKYYYRRRMEEDLVIEEENGYEHGGG